jgi:DNA-binding CsgD family transcriptional regulator
MWQDTTTTSGGGESQRLGDVAAMLRVMRPLNGAMADPILRRRRLLADLCRLVGMSLGTVEPRSDVRPVPEPAPATAVPNPVPNPVASQSTNGSELSPRLDQTLRHLLGGASEKEVAHRLKLSPHTVHVYVKALYRHYGVRSRAELLAKHLQR